MFALLLEREYEAFQSTLPARGSDPASLQSVRHSRRNFNPRSPQGGATRAGVVVRLLVKISIHAPRKGERRLYDIAPEIDATISIHAPRKGERPTQGRGNCGLHGNFNPRSPQGGATSISVPSSSIRRNFNPRSPQGGATPSHGGVEHVIQDFNPRSPQGGATRQKWN